MEVRARVGGILMKRVYEEGAAVKAGQPSSRSTGRRFEVAVAQARPSWPKQGPRGADPARGARLKGLLAQQAISQREYDTASSDNAATLAAVQAAQVNPCAKAELNLLRHRHRSGQRHHRPAQFPRHPRRLRRRHPADHRGPGQSDLGTFLGGRAISPPTMPDGHFKNRRRSVASN